MEIVWVQVFDQGASREVVSFVGEEPMEEDYGVYFGDENPNKHFFRALLGEDSRVVRILDEETGEDRTSIPWVRELITSVLMDHQG